MKCKSMAPFFFFQGFKGDSRRILGDIGLLLLLLLLLNAAATVVIIVAAGTGGDVRTEKEEMDDTLFSL